MKYANTHPINSYRYTPFTCTHIMPNKPFGSIFSAANFHLSFIFAVFFCEKASVLRAEEKKQLKTFSSRILLARIFFVVVCYTQISFLINFCLDNFYYNLSERCITVTIISNISSSINNSIIFCLMML